MGDRLTVALSCHPAEWDPRRQRPPLVLGPLLLTHLRGVPSPGDAGGAPRVLTPERGPEALALRPSGLPCRWAGAFGLRARSRVWPERRRGGRRRPGKGLLPAGGPRPEKRTLDFRVPFYNLREHIHCRECVWLTYSSVKCLANECVYPQNPGGPAPVTMTARLPPRRGWRFSVAGSAPAPRERTPGPGSGFSGLRSAQPTCSPSENPTPVLRLRARITRSVSRWTKITIS